MRQPRGEREGSRGEDGFFSSAEDAPVSSAWGWQIPPMPPPPPVGSFSLFGALLSGKGLRSTREPARMTPGCLTALLGLLSSRSKRLPSPPASAAP